MQKVTFINAKGENISFYANPPFILNSIEGLGDVPNSINSQKSPYQDGETYIDTRLGPRPIPITFTIKGKNYGEISNYRRQISAIFNPRLGEGTLIYEIENIRREIVVVCDGSPSFPSGNSRGNTFQVGAIDLIAHNPFWVTEENTDQLVVWEGGLTFPLQFPTTFASLSASKSKLLVNDGDVETPILITFNGPATAPITVKNVTAGKYIQINRSLAVGEKLEINTAFGQKKVTKVLADGTRENATHYIKIPGSEFFNLEVGNNLIEYSTGSDYEQAGVSIQWRNRFLAV